MRKRKSNCSIMHRTILIHMIVRNIQRRRNQLLRRTIPMALREDQKTQRLILKIIGLLKMHANEYLMLSSEAAALKDVLQAISGEKFLPLFEKYRADADQRGARESADVLRIYEEM